MPTGSLWRILGPAILISVGGSFHYGYQLTVVNPSENMFRAFINASYHEHYQSYLDDGQWSYVWTLVVNAQAIGTLMGTCFVKYLIEKFGRKRNFYLTNIVALVGCLLQGIAKPSNSWELFVAGRFISGLAQGVQLGLQPVYFNEISPKSKRGQIGSLTGFTLEFGFLLASVLALPEILGGARTWPYLLVVEAVPSLVTLTALPYLHESPKFLASRGHYAAAERSLHFFGRTDEEIKEELKEIRDELAKDSANAKSAMSLKDLLSTPYIRKGVLLGWLVNFSSIFCGISALSYFSTSILQNSGVSERDAQYGTIAMTAPACLGAFFAGFIFDRFGRRPILLVANAVLLALNILFIIFAHLARVYGIAWASYVNIAAASLICLTFGLGPANAMFLLTAELVPQRARATAQMGAIFVQRASGGLAGLIFYPLQKAVNEFCFLLHIVPLTVAIVCFAWALPETKNRSTLEIMKKLGYKEEEEEKKNNDVMKF